MAKIAEIAYLTQQIHKRIVDSGDMSVPGKFASTVGEKWKYLAELNDANKTSTLVGDLLWAQVFNCSVLVGFCILSKLE